jgi:hypothetical protein
VSTAATEHQRCAESSWTAADDHHIEHPVGGTARARPWIDTEIGRCTNLRIDELLSRNPTMKSVNS